MKIYRVHHYCTVEGSQGFSFHPSLERAETARAQFNREWKDKDPRVSIEPIIFKPTLMGILYLLNTYASHNDNG